MKVTSPHLLSKGHLWAKDFTFRYSPRSFQLSNVLKVMDLNFKNGGEIFNPIRLSYKGRGVSVFRLYLQVTLTKLSDI